MSISSLSDPNGRIGKKLFHRKNESDELEVFEATEYFFGHNDTDHAYYSSSSFTHKTPKKEKNQIRETRMSLDNVSVGNINVPPPQSYTVKDQKQMKEVQKRRNKLQPGSPGVKLLVNFLDSIFGYSSSASKNKSKSCTKSVKDFEDKKSRMCDFQSSLEMKLCTALEVSTVLDEKIEKETLYGFDEKQYYSRYSDQMMKTDSRNGYSEKDRVSFDKYSLEEELLRKLDVEIDEGEESDSSSDLFELKICELSFYSGGDLPVYGTTTHKEKLH